ncbi:hypothetical protein [Methanopyrus kandleri]
MGGDVREAFGLALVVLIAASSAGAGVAAGMQENPTWEEWALSHVTVAVAGGMISFAAAYALASVAEAVTGGHVGEHGRGEVEASATSAEVPSVYGRGAAVGLKAGTILSPALPMTSASIGVISGYLMSADAWRGTLGEWADVLAGLGIVDASIKGAVLLSSFDVPLLTSLIEGERDPSHDPRMEGVGLAIVGLLFLLPTISATAEVVWGPLVVTLVTALNAWYAVKALSSGPSPLVPLALLEPGLAVLCVVCEPVRMWLAGIPKLVAGALMCLEGPVDPLPGGRGIRRR